MVSPATASASTTGRPSSTVTILPPRRTRSAGGAAERDWVAVSTVTGVNTAAAISAIEAMRFICERSLSRRPWIRHEKHETHEEERGFVYFVFSCVSWRLFRRTDSPQILRQYENLTSATTDRLR